MKITPSFVQNLETAMQFSITNGMSRVANSIMWNKVMAQRSSSTRTELIYFLLETARLEDQGLAGEVRRDDLAAKFMTVENRRTGAGLRLRKEEIEDNIMASGAPALDYAKQWSDQIGAASVYYPQQKMFDLITGGESVQADASVYDGLAFFHASHPINPVVGASAGTYSNLIPSKPIDFDVTLAVAQANLASVLGTIAAYTMPNGIRRFLKPAMLLHSVEIAPRVSEMLTARYVGSTENVGYTSLGIQPMACPELTGKNWYLVCEPTPGEGGGLIFQQREAYTLNTFAPESAPALMARKEFEWDFSGRNAIAYGHPYLLVKVKAGA